MKKQDMLELRDKGRHHIASSKSGLPKAYRFREFDFQLFAVRGCSKSKGSLYLEFTASQFIILNIARM